MQQLKRFFQHQCSTSSTIGALSLTLCFLILTVLDVQAADTGGFNNAKLKAMDTAVTKAIANRKLPGGVVWLERQGHQYIQSYGQRAVAPKTESMTLNTVFDAASLTKVVATTPAMMLLVERGLVRLDNPVRDYLPDFKGENSGSITVRHLMTHTSGLRPGLSARPAWSGYAIGIEKACQESPQKPPGTAFRYSDINFILLGEIVQRLAKQSLESFVRKEIYLPLGMRDTGYRPPAAKRFRIAPTTKSDDGYIRGVVHDPTSRRMGGVAGHAGLFTTAADLARYARMMLNEGALDGVRIFKPSTVRLMTSVQSPAAVKDSRGLGWDINSPYASPRGAIFPIGSYGHTGWTGTSLWIDPYSRTFLIFLSNRNHPTEDGTVVALRKELGTLAGEAVKDFDFSVVAEALAPGTRYSQEPTESPGPKVIPQVLNGIDVLVKQNFAPIKKLRVGLITNHTGVDHQRRRTIDILQEAEEVTLAALFSPEHGLRGVRDEKLGDAIDVRTGLPVFSLYGDHKAPTPEQLKDLDALVFDIQDIGCRFYTYVSTMGLCLEAAGKAGLKFVVLDRVNPINGVKVEGPVYHGEPEFVAFHSLPVRHGMTVGELARMFNEEKSWQTDLTVVPLEGWNRNMWFDDTGLPWINPSPNMRNLTEAILYPGVGLLETALSVGRGTDTPFEIMGAPYISDTYLAEKLNDMEIPGIRFVPVKFRPKASVFKDQTCGGVYMILTDREKCSILDVGLATALILQQTNTGQFALEKFNRLLQSKTVIEAIREAKTLEQIKKSWAGELSEFNERRSKYLIYR